MADFREKIDRLQETHSTNELKDALADRLGTRPTSVNPLTQAMFDYLVPEHQPGEYARRSEADPTEMSRVKKNATALKILLHMQVGRPLYEPVERLVKQDFAECIAAVDAHDDGYERGMGKHVPTTLPREVDSFVRSPPERTSTPTSPFDAIVEVDTDCNIPISQLVSNHLDDTDASYFVYVLDCTPVVGGEKHTKLWDRRRAVQTKIEAGIPHSELEPKEQATDALNQAKRVYYVGSTQDVPQRVHDHIVGTDKSGVNFTNTLSPRSLVKVQGCNSRKRAESLEGTLARKLNDEERLFAYSDEM